MSDVSLIIGGERQAAHETFPVINPATGEAHATAPSCSAAQLDDAFNAATKAYADWRLDDDARRNGLRSAATALFAAAERIAPVLTAEQGKPLGEATMEVMGAGVWLQYYAELDMPREVIQDDQVAHVEVVHRPMGVVAAITPWNFPLLLAAWKIAPALRAGNTMVLKPSPFTPRSTLMMVEVLNEALPAGVLNAVAGGDDLGQRMTSHAVPRKISFTGSVAAGKHVAASAAADLKRTTLELGGNDAAIVLEDADIEAIAERLFLGAFGNCGQICSAIKRVYVHEHLHDDLVGALAERAGATKVGDGMDATTQMGPINNAPQYQRVRELIQGALDDGGTAAAGREPLEGPGYFVAPTVLTGVAEGSRIVDEEQFGPVIPVMSFRDDAEAVARANATTFGLSGSVWSTDEERAGSLAAQLDCGTAWVNTHLALAPHQPFGGFKWSGVGVENGILGLTSFTDVQVLHRPSKAQS